MGKPTGFMEYARQDRTYAPAADRVTHFDEFVIPLSEEDLVVQGARCMDCGIPYCHTGCPVNNLIPDWNDTVYRQDWQKAVQMLHSTNNFPEFTGRICPAPCEDGCNRNEVEDHVGINSVEQFIGDYGLEHGLIVATTGDVMNVRSRTS